MQISKYELGRVKLVGILAYGVAVVGALTSYGVQVGLLQAHGMAWEAFAIPATVDALAIASAVTLSLPRVTTETRKFARKVLLGTVLTSVVANMMGAHDLVSALAHAWPVLAYLMGETLAGKAKADYATAQEEVKPERVYSERHVRRLKAKARAAK